MAYTTRADLLTSINGQDLIPFLDDDGDGIEDTGLLDNIISNCSDEINGMLASIYAIPFVITPPLCHTACNVFVWEALYARRLTPTEKNPYTERATMWRERLMKIGDGEVPLDLNTTRDFEPGAVVTAPVIFAGTSM